MYLAGFISTAAGTPTDLIDRMTTEFADCVSFADREGVVFLSATPREGQDQRCIIGLVRRLGTTFKHEDFCSTAKTYKHLELRHGGAFANARIDVFAGNVFVASGKNELAKTDQLHIGGGTIACFAK